MEQGFKLGDMLKNKALATIKIEAFDLKTDPCLPKPIMTEKMKLAPLIGIMFACFISCILDAYCARWRSMICNKFFPERATSRSRYLYKKILAGRGQRRFQLRLIAIREKFKADRLLEISIGGKLSQCWNGLMGRLGIQAFLDYRGFNFRDFRSTAVYNSILFSSPLVLVTSIYAVFASAVFCVLTLTA